MQYLWAPDADLADNRFTTLARAHLSATPDNGEQTNGETLRISKVWWSGPFEVTGLSLPKANIAGDGPYQFVVAPSADFDGAGNLITVANAILSDALDFDGLSAGTWRAGVLTPPSDPETILGEADAFGPLDWSWSDTVSESGDRINWAPIRLPSGGGYEPLDIEIQTGTDDGSGNILWGAIRSAGLEAGQVPVLAEAPAAARIRLVTDWPDNPWSEPKWALPSKPAVAAETQITVGGTTFRIQGDVSFITHADGGVRVLSSGPVTFLGKIPETTGAGTTALRHGSVLNPRRGRNGYDGRLAYRNYTDTITYPITINPGDGILAVASRGEVALTGSQLTAELKQGIPDTFSFIYVAATTADPGTPTPTSVRWTGRTDFVTPYPAIDYIAIAAALPRDFGVPGWTYRSIASIQRRLRFNPAYAIETGTGGLNGYEGFYPYQWAGDAPYGRNQTSALATFFCHLPAPIEQVPLETKAEILKWFDSYAIQNAPPLARNRSELSADGGHRQFYQMIFALHYWMRGDSTSLMTCLTDWKGNVEQFFRIDQTMVDTWMQPYGNPDSPTSAYATPRVPVYGWRRRITAVDTVAKRISFAFNEGGSGGKAGESVKARYTGLMWNHEASGYQSVVTSAYDATNGDWNSGDIVKIGIKDWPATDPAVGDVMYFTSEFPLTLDMPAWRIEGPGFNNFYNPSADASYRELQRMFGCMFLFRAMGEFRPDWKVIWDYFVLAAGSAWPSAINDYGIDPDDGVGLSSLKEGSLEEALWNRHKTALLAVPQPYLGDAPLSPFYPNVPALDLSLPAGSLALPEANNAYAGKSAGLLKWRGAASITKTSAWPNILSSANKQAMVAIVSLPADKRYSSNALPIFGTAGTDAGDFSLVFNGTQVSPNGGRFKYYQRGFGGSGVTLYSQVWPKSWKSVQVVAMCDGANHWQLDLYNPEDGTRLAGSVVTQAVPNMGDPADAAVGIGAITAAQAYSASNFGTAHWPGSIEVLAYAKGALATDPATWVRIALGANIEDIFAPADAGIYRHFRGGDAASLAPVPWNTSDLTPAAIPFAGVTLADGTVVPAASLAGGSHFRRQSESQWILPALLSHGWVFGILPGQSSHTVFFSGKSQGLSGNAEIRVVEVGTGKVVRDWTSLGAIDSGTGNWGGLVELPKCDRGQWFIAQFRASGQPSIVAVMAEHFAIGWKILLDGQSQLQGAVYADYAGGQEIQSPMSASLLTDNGSYDKVTQITTTYLTIDRIGMRRRNAGLAYFMNQFRQFDPLTPVMIIEEAVNGTSIDWILYTAQERGLRAWWMIQDKLDAYGNDVSCAVHQWYTNDAGKTESQWKDTLTKLFLAQGSADHSFATALQPGFKVAISPPTRYGGATTHDDARSYAVDWAYLNNIAVGPPLSDFEIQPANGPHSTNDTLMGGVNLMVGMAVAAARALGLDTSQNPSIKGATRAPDGSSVTVTFNLPNGGSLYCPTPGAVKSFKINGSSSGFTAVQSGDTVVLTPTTGIIAAGSTISYNSNLASRADGDAAAETAIIDSALYETWSKDVRGRGLQIIGFLDAGGKWRPANWTATVA